MSAFRQLRFWFAVVISLGAVIALAGNAGAQTRGRGGPGFRGPGGFSSGGFKGLNIPPVIGRGGGIEIDGSDRRKRRRIRDRRPGGADMVVDTVRDASRQERRRHRHRHRKPPKIIVDTGEPGSRASRSAEKPAKRSKPPVRVGAAAPIGAVRGDIRQREVIFTLAATAPENLANDIGRELGLRADTSYTSALLGLRVVRLTIPDKRSVSDVMRRLSRHPDIVSVQPSYVYRATQAAAVALAVPQYAPEKLRLAEAHRLSSGKRVSVAVIDTGVDQEHPELKGAVAETFNAIGDDKPAAEPHGTAIAGIVAARSALMGVAPDSKIMAARAFTSGGSGAAQSTSMTLLKSIDWAYTTGARVVNMSFAGPEDALLKQVIDAGTAKGLIFVAAAGNNGPKAPPAYPAAFANVIAVTASDSSDGVYSQANRGRYISVAAPGVDIIAPALEGRYEMSSGTSLAAAHVSGIVALLLELKPDLKPGEVRIALTKAARKPEAAKRTEGLGAGIVDAAKVVGASP